MADREQLVVIDADSHVTEPPDLWTSRLGKQWIDQAPRVVRDEKRGFDRWWVGDKRLGGVAASAAAGWHEYPPAFPPTLDEAHPGAWNAGDRLRVLDEYGVWAQVLYPNLLGFSQFAFLALEEEMRRECFKAYNDFLIDFASEDPRRYIPILAVPYWDVDFAVSEVKRGAAKGHKGLLFPSRFDKIDLPPIWHRHWDPLYAVAQDLGLSINFHTAFSSILTEAELRSAAARDYDKSVGDFARSGGLIMLDAQRTLGDLLMSDVGDRFPALNFVIVESGVGWVPYMLESLDWSWKGAGGAGLMGRSLDSSLPSEVFRRQVYSTFWFEDEALFANMGLIPDNIMFSTDFPHPTSLSPGPASPAPHPAEKIADIIKGAGDLADKVLYSNAARVYHHDI